MRALETPLLVVGCVLFLGAAAYAQTAGVGRPGSPAYDLKSETTITGTVGSVEQIKAPGRRGRRGLGGTHLVVKTEKETIEVHLGPTDYLAGQKITITTDDTVEIRGSRVTVDGEPVLLVRQITKGGTVYTLRDEQGRPLWSRGRR